LGFTSPVNFVHRRSLHFEIGLKCLQVDPHSIFPGRNNYTSWRITSAKSRITKLAAMHRDFRAVISFKWRRLSSLTNIPTTPDNFNRYGAPPYHLGIHREDPLNQIIRNYRTLRRFSLDSQTYYPYTDRIRERVPVTYHSWVCGRIVGGCREAKPMNCDCGFSTLRQTWKCKTSRSCT